MRCVGREGKHMTAKGARGERWEGGRGREGAAHVCGARALGKRAAASPLTKKN